MHIIGLQHAPSAATTPPIRLSTAAASTGQTSSGGNTSGGGISSTFLQLLTTELQTQNPLSAQDPTTYITQLVQLNTLDQLTQIHSLLVAQNSAPPAKGAASGSAAAASPTTASLANFLKGVQA